ncbi:MAG: hydrogenase nickel incorporation protein HypB [Rubripirellula sp.]
MPIPRIIEVRTKILKKNDELARDMREQFRDAGVLVVNLVSSPGAGKTTLLTKTLSRIRQSGQQAAAIVGDLETDNDAKRLSESGVPVRQIMTHGCCHLEADMVQEHLHDWDLSQLDYLFIENVGNLVCPTSWDLGESLRVVLMSVTEGEDKPQKYPGLFNTADLALITKTDLAIPCEFDRVTALSKIDAVRPGIPVIETSSKNEDGFDVWLEYLRRAQSRTNDSSLPR